MTSETIQLLLNACADFQSFSFQDYLNSAFLPFFLMPIWLIVSIAICPLILYRYKSSVTNLMGGISSDHRTSLKSYLHSVDKTNSRILKLENPAELQMIIEDNIKHYRNMILGVVLTLSVILAAMVNVALFEVQAANSITLFILEFLIYLIIILSLGACIYVAARVPKKLIVLYFCLSIVSLVGLNIIRQTFHEASDTSNPTYLIVISIPISLLLYIGICGRQTRTIAPFFTIAIALASGMMFIISFFYLFGACSFSFLDYTWSYATFVIAIIIAISITLLTSLSFLADNYIRKRISERHLGYISWILIVTGCFLAAFIDENNEHFRLDTNWVPLLFGMIFCILMCFVFVKGKRQASLTHSLLFLRVFGRDKKGEKLVSELKDHWSFIGPINLIAGPDLAKSTFGPSELYLFLTWRLKSIFIDSIESANTSLATIDCLPDPDGRYRVNDLFCLDHIWETVAQGLIRQSDYILLDLRGFDLSRVGTAKELLFLTNGKAILTTIILIESESDIDKHIKLINDISGYKVSASQFATEKEWVVEKQIRQILELGHKNIHTSKDDKYTDHGLSENLVKLDKAVLEHHEEIVKKHNQTHYKFSYLVLLLALGGIIAGGLWHLLAPVYLLFRKTSIKRTLVVFVTAQAFASTGKLFDSYIFPTAERLNSLPVYLAVIFILVCFVAALPIVWIRICKRTNLWIAEGHEPLRSSITFVKKHNCSTTPENQYT